MSVDFGAGWCGAEGGVLIEGCTAGLDGGGIYALAPLELSPSAAAARRVTLVRNTAGRTGGGARALGASAGITVASGAGLTVAGNSAGLDGGGIALAGGAGLGAAGGCPAAICPASRRGDGACDPGCMTIGCNWYIADPNLNNPIFWAHHHLTLTSHRHTPNHPCLVCVR